MHRTVIRVSLTLAVFLATAGYATAQDKIYLKSSTVVLEGRVEDLDFREVRYESANGNIPTSQTSKDVRTIEFDPNNKSFEYADGETKFNNNEFAEAKAKFDRVGTDTRASKALKQFARWYSVLCVLESGDWTTSLKAIRDFRAAYPESYFLRESFAQQYYAARGAGNVSEIDSAIKEFDKASVDLKMEDWKKSVDLLRGDLAEGKQDFRTAKSTYDRYTADRDPQIAISARLGLLRALAGLQDWSSLASRAEAYISECKGKQNSPVKLLLGAYLAKGKALLLGDKKVKEALIEFLRAVLDIAPKAREECVEHEEAIAFAALSCARYATEQKEPEKRALYRDRATELRASLQHRYANSKLLSIVDKEIDSIPK